MMMTEEWGFLLNTEGVFFLVRVRVWQLVRSNSGRDLVGQGLQKQAPDLQLVFSKVNNRYQLILSLALIF